MNCLSNLDETYREYSLAPIDNVLRFWRSEVKVTAGRLGSKDIHVYTGASKSIFWLLFWVGRKTLTRSVSQVNYLCY